MPLDRRRVLRWMGAGVLALTPEMKASAAASSTDKRPNFLFFMTDDQAQSALSIYGNQILSTPHMDRIGREGIRFQQAFVTNSLCAPSRASFLTGLYSHTHGITTNGEESGWYEQEGLQDDLATWPSVLRRGGYSTAVVGKWHLKSLPHSFDHFAILPGHGQYFDPHLIVDGAQARAQGPTDDVIAERALAWLDRRPKDRPFCLLCQFKAPHSPWQAASRFDDDFADVEIPIPRNFTSLPERIPDAVRTTQMSVAEMDFTSRGVPRTLPADERARENLQTLVKNYYRTLRGVDENVGRVLAYLDTHGLADNTVVVYTSDNGFFLGEFGLFDKRLMFEPSIRVPMLMRWPSHIAPGRVDTQHLVLNIDVAPTLLDVAGFTVPASMQGSSWLPLLTKQAAPWREDFLYEFYEYPAVHCVRKHRGVRTTRWKLIHFWEEPQEFALYDLRNDPEELVNLADRREHAQRLTELKNRLLELRRATGDIDPPGYKTPSLNPGKCAA